MHSSRYINQTIVNNTELNQEEIGLDFDPDEYADWTMKYQTTIDEVLMGDDVGHISTRDLIFWSFQIARGSNFLASTKVLCIYLRHVHRLSNTLRVYLIVHFTYTDQNHLNY